MVTALDNANGNPISGAKRVLVERAATPVQSIILHVTIGRGWRERSTKGHCITNCKRYPDLERIPAPPKFNDRDRSPTKHPFFGVFKQSRR